MANTAEITLAANQDCFLISSADILIHGDQNPFLAFIASLPSPASKRTMRSSLEMVAKILTNGEVSAENLPWHLVRVQHTAAIRAKIIESYAPASVNKILSALRGVIIQCEILGLITADELHRATSIKNVKNNSELRGRALSPLEMRDLFVACNDGTPLGARDAALLALLYMGGAARRSEVVALDMSDYDQTTGKLRHRHGKGDKFRFDFLAGGAKDALEAWLTIRSDIEGPLLVPVKKGGHVVIDRLTDQAVREALIERAKKAGVSSFTPHDIRRTAISDYLDAGVDITTVAKKVGHSSVEQTAKYDRRDERAIAAASHRLNVPFRTS